VVSGPTTLVADGLDAATLTLTVEDAGGRTVQTYNGAITVSASAPATVGVVGPGGSVATAPLTVVAADGVAQVSVRAGLTVGAQATIDARVGGDVNGSTTIATQAQVATAVSVQAASAAMAETKGTMDTVTGEVVDQAGFPMLTGTYPISFSLSQAAPDAVKLVNGGSNEGNGPVTLTFTGGSARPPTLALEATGAGAGSVAVDASTTATGVKAGSTTVHVVGSLPQGQAGTVDGLALAPEAGQGGVSVGGASLYSLSYTGTGTTPIPAPSALTVTLTAPSSGGGSAAFTDLPNGATSGAGGTTATVTIPQGTATISFGLSGESAGEVVLTAEASLPAEGDAPATTLGATLPVEVGAEAANPVGGVVLTVAGESSTTGNGTIGPGVAADVTAAGTEIPVTITLVGPTGQPVFAPEPEVVILSDQGLVAAPDGSEVPANTMSAGGSFAIDGSTASPVVVVPQGSSSLLVTYTNQDPGTYTLEAEVLDPVASGLATAAALSSQGTTATYSVNLVAVGLPQDEVLGNFAADIAVTSDLLQAPPTGEQVSTGGGGVYSVTVPWSNAPPAADSLYAEIEASGTSGPQAVTLGAPPTPALAESLTASTATLAIPASQGSAQLSYTVTASGRYAADVQVQVRLANAAGSDLSLSATGASTLANLTTNASGSATLTVYGSVVPDEATLSATLPSEPALNPVVTSVSVVSSGQDELLAPATELGATAFTADQGGEPLDFEVESPGGAPVAGATVDFTMAVGSNGLSLSRSSAKTNAQGVAVVRVRGYVTSAEGAVVASLPSAAGVSVSTGPITVEPGAPAEFATSLPAGDTITADTAHAGVRLLVILQDQYGNPIPGPDTLEIATSGPLSAANGQATTVTGSGGEALISLTDPTGAVGATTITVTDPSANGLHMTLPLTVTSGAPAAVTVQPLSTTQTQAGGTVPIELTATDAFGNPVSGTYPVTLGGTAVAPAPRRRTPPSTSPSPTARRPSRSSSTPSSPSPPRRSRCPSTACRRSPFPAPWTSCRGTRSTPSSRASRAPRAAP
ncbi:MAG: hypothetical protein M0007_10840, partial [Actinomycetota bacterium]|nr:hypothetical protein [Actinomycetota bacterium]